MSQLPSSLYAGINKVCFRHTPVFNTGDTNARTTPNKCQESWLLAEFGWTDQTSRNLMAAAELFGPKTEMISDLAISPTSAYLLPDRPILDFYEHAVNGTIAMVKKLKMPASKLIR